MTWKHQLLFYNICLWFMDWIPKVKETLPFLLVLYVYVKRHGILLDVKTKDNNDINMEIINIDNTDNDCIWSIGKLGISKTCILMGYHHISFFLFLISFVTLCSDWILSQSDIFMLHQWMLSFLIWYLYLISVPLWL